MPWMTRSDSATVSVAPVSRHRWTDRWGWCRERSIRRRCYDDPSICQCDQFGSLSHSRPVPGAGGTGDRLCVDAALFFRSASSFARVRSFSALCLVLPDGLAEWSDGIGTHGSRPSGCHLVGDPFPSFTLCVSFCVTLLSCSACFHARIIQAERVPRLRKWVMSLTAPRPPFSRTHST